MKFFTTITLGLLSLNAMALPILTEIQEGKLPVFKDHKDPQKIHFIFDEGGLAFDRDEVAKFRLDDGYLSANFEMKKSQKLQSFIEKNLDNGSQVSVLPVMSSFLNVENSWGYFMKGDVVRDAGQFGDVIGYSAILTNKGAQYLPDLLKTRPASVRNFSACYEVSGISPEYDALVEFNAAKVSWFFKALTIDPIKYTKTSIKESVKILLSSKWITLKVNGGEASNDDYAAAITDHLIKTNFVHDYGNQYVLNPLEQFDGLARLEIKGKQNIQREYCIQINLRALKIFPELIN